MRVKWRNRLKLLILLIVFIAFTFAIRYAYWQIQIDRCLDRGGRWDYVNDVCED
jgi:hypothetical protein